MTCKDSSRKKADGMSSLVYRFYGIVGGYLTAVVSQGLKGLDGRPRKGVDDMCLCISHSVS
jgi:hypothetical protein